MSDLNPETIYQCENLSLELSSPFHHNASLRENFISLTKNPLEFLLSKENTLAVLRNVSMQINKGDRIGLIGRNGAGKTTLCRCLTGLFSPTSGSQKIQGHTRGIFETSVGIYPDLSGRENAELLAKFLYPNETKIEVTKILDDVISFSDLGDYIDMPFRIYSNGMQTRLCLSLVTSKPTDLLILDEVFDGADRFFREKMSMRMESLANNSGAVVFVSHSLDQVKNFCNRVIVLEAGTIIFDGEVDAGIQCYLDLQPDKTSPAMNLKNQG